MVRAASVGFVQKSSAMDQFVQVGKEEPAEQVTSGSSWTPDRMREASMDDEKQAGNLMQLEEEPAAAGGEAANAGTKKEKPKKAPEPPV
jgi:hypothetical protein